MHNLRENEFSHEKFRQEILSALLVCTGQGGEREALQWPHLYSLAHVQAKTQRRALPML